MPSKKNSKNSKKVGIKYRKISFKISDKEKKKIDNYCRIYKTTPNKIFKKSIREYIEKNGKEPIIFEDENQLTLFEEIENLDNTKEFEDETHSNIKPN